MRSKVLLAVASATAFILAGCLTKSEFTAPGSAVFEPRPADYVIEVLEEMPDSGYVLLGYAEARGQTIGGALPNLIRHAREAGGDALVGITTSVFNNNLGYGQTTSYRAAVIRYASPQDSP